MVKSYKKKSVIIEAIQWEVNIESEYEIEKFVGKRLPWGNSPDELVIETLEGNHIVSPFDFIIKGINGEFYPCKEDVFWKTYELVS